MLTTIPFSISLFITQSNIYHYNRPWFEKKKTYEKVSHFNQKWNNYPKKQLHTINENKDTYNSILKSQHSSL